MNLKQDWNSGCYGPSRLGHSQSSAYPRQFPHNATISWVFWLLLHVFLQSNNTPKRIFWKTPFTSRNIAPWWAFIFKKSLKNIRQQRHFNSQKSFLKVAYRTLKVMVNNISSIMMVTVPRNELAAFPSWNQITQTWQKPARVLWLA